MRTIAERLAYNRRYTPHLNELIFDENDQLRPQVKDKVIQIVDAFLEYAEVDTVKVYDIRLVGSNASYNYNEHSDLDIHIVTDLSKIADPETIARLYFDATKKNFRDSYDIKIKGIDVEIYVEDINATAVTNGIYSVTQDKWIKEPVPMEDPTDEEFAEAEEIEMDIIRSIKQATSVSELEEIIDDLYLLRKDSLSKDGETSAGNLAFKSLRNKGILDKIKDIIRDKESKELSLESKNLKESSAGDITLLKFLFIYSEDLHLEDYAEYYNSSLFGYYIPWYCSYNIYTRVGDSREKSHSGEIDKLPHELRKRYNLYGVWGREDYYPHKDNSYISVFISDRPRDLPLRVYNSLKSYVRSTTSIKRF